MSGFINPSAPSLDHRALPFEATGFQNPAQPLVQARQAASAAENSAVLAASYRDATGVLSNYTANNVAAANAAITQFYSVVASTTQLVLSTANTVSNTSVLLLNKANTVADTSVLLLNTANAVFLAEQAASDSANAAAASAANIANGPVSAFNGRGGSVTLSSSDVTTALTYTPQRQAAVLTGLSGGNPTVAVTDGQIVIFSGNTNGARFTFNSNGTLLEGVDKTGVGSYESITVHGSTVSLVGATVQANGYDVVTAGQAASNADVLAGSSSVWFTTPYALVHSAFPQTLTDNATILWNMASGYNAEVTLGGARTLAAPTGYKKGLTYVLKVNQDGTGSRTLSANACYDFGSAGAPVLSTANGKSDYFFLYCADDTAPKFRVGFSQSA